MTQITLELDEKAFKHMRELQGWIKRNRSAARVRLDKYEDIPKSGDPLDDARRSKLAAAAELSLVQWGTYGMLIDKILEHEPKDPELFDGLGQTATAEANKGASNADQEKGEENHQEEAEKVGQDEGGTQAQEDQPRAVQHDGSGDAQQVSGDGQEASAQPVDRHDEGPESGAGG